MPFCLLFPQRVTFEEKCIKTVKSSNVFEHKDDNGSLGSGHKSYKSQDKMLAPKMKAYCHPVLGKGAAVCKRINITESAALIPSVHL